MALDSRLRPYQLEGIEFLRRRPYALLADDFGLGKTAQALYAIRGDKSLIVTTNTLRSHWIDEITKWLPDRQGEILEITKHNYKSAIKSFKMGFLIIGYDTLKLIPEFQYYQFTDIILDEAHHIRNRRSIRSRAIRKLVSPHKIAISATPLINHPHELWAILNFLAPNRFTSYWKWLETFVILVKRPYGWKPMGIRPSAKHLLERILGEFVIARTVDQVMPQLPDLIYDPFSLDLPVHLKRVHDEFMTELFVNVDKGIWKISNALVGNMRARQLCCYPPLVGMDDDGPKVEFLTELLEVTPARAVVIFSQFVKVHEALTNHIPGLIIINGDIDIQERIKRLKKYQSEGGILIGNQPILGEGVDLSMSDLLIWYDRPWSPAYIEQGRRRVRRFGLNRPVREVNLMIKDSVETDIQELLIEKGLQLDEVYKIMRSHYIKDDISSRKDS